MAAAALIVSIVAVLLSGLAVFYTRLQAVTAERARAEANDPIFRAMWIRDQMSVAGAELDASTGQYPMEPVQTRFWVRNIGTGDALDLVWGVRGAMHGPADATATWSVRWRRDELHDRRVFHLRWRTPDGKRKRRRIRIGNPLALPPFYDRHGRCREEL